MIADDEKNLREVLQAELSRESFAVSTADSGKTALELLAKNEYDVLVLDLNMPGIDGLAVLKRISELDSLVETVVLTANATVASAVDAMKYGAYDYLRKPVDLDELETVIKKAYESKKLRSEHLLLKTQLQRQADDAKLVFTSPVMRALLDTVGKMAGTEYSILITGESGTGKELIARSLHQRSSRADGPFVAINCGAIPEGMIESELFGYEKGAFTGAYGRKLGILELAQGGTLFLDEIGDMPLQLQVKLLRVIETSRYYRLGGTRELTSNVRYLSATNKDLKQESMRGTFRQDLYYRITGLTIAVPPLRDRVEDISLLVEHFRMAELVFRQKRFSREALSVLERYGWPGNVRELQNVVQRALLLSRSDVVMPSDLPPDLEGAGPVIPTGKTRKLEEVEREHILRVLAETGGRREQAAAILGIHARTLRRKLAEYGITA